MKKTLCFVLSLLLPLCCVPVLAADLNGVWDGDTYANAFADLTFRLPQDWWVYPEDRLSDLMAVSAKMYREAGIEGIDVDALASPELSYMQAMGRHGLAQASLQVESATYQGESMTWEAYLDTNLRLMEGIGYTFPVQEEVEIWGHPYTALRGNLSSGGLSLLVHNYLREQDGYFISVFIAAHSEEELESLLACFE